MNSHLLVRVVGVRRLVDDQLGGRPAQLLAGLADRGQRNGGGGGELDVVVAHDRQVVGHLQPGADRLLEQAERDQVVGAEGRGRPRPRGIPASRSPADAALGDGERRAGPRPGLLGQPGLGPGLAAPSSRSRTCPMECGPPTNATRVCPRSTRCATASRPPSTSSTATEQKLVVLPGPVHDHDRGAAPGDRVQGRRLGVDRGDQDALHPLLLEVRRWVSSRVGAVVAVADEQREAGRLRGQLDALRDVGEERVAGVEHHVGERAGCARPGAARADSLRTNPSSAIARSTRSRVPALTRSGG